MAKTIFRKNEILTNDGRVTLQLTPVSRESDFDDEFVLANESAEPEYTGPTVEEIQQEIADLRAAWADEKEMLLAEARQEAEKIIADAKDAAFTEVKTQTDIAQTIKTDAEAQAEEIIKHAEEKSAAIITEAEAQKSTIENTAKEKGFTKGEDEGYKEGKDEAERLIERMHTVLERINAKRQEILDESEGQIVTLVLLLARKVIKIISDNQKEVVLANVHEALKKVRSGGDVIIRVNMDDVKLTTAHSKEFITSIENASGAVAGISIVEDSSVGRGGCVVETDFGAVDARVASQLAILEQKILEFSPVKMHAQVRAQEFPQRDDVPIVMTDEMPPPAKKASPPPAASDAEAQKPAAPTNGQSGAQSTARPNGQPTAQPNAGAAAKPPPKEA
ncbi:MAG: flagellar assembly protein FliH [Treponemataceae bacterium]|nr:MAG: flagellar assembly protein FliH [Treponemataceae bacterium]